MASEKDLTMNVGINVTRDQTIREIQTSLPWTIRYSRDYRANPQSHKDFAHALVHVTKALGHLMGLVDDMDHRREVADDATLRERYGKYVADLVVCAVRAANVFPGGVLDLQTATQDRIEVKNAPEEKGGGVGFGQSVHWEARDADNQTIGTFWAPHGGMAYRAGIEMYPAMRTFHLLR